MQTGLPIGLLCRLISRSSPLWFSFSVELTSFASLRSKNVNWFLAFHAGVSFAGWNRLPACSVRQLAGQAFLLIQNIKKTVGW